MMYLLVTALLLGYGYAPTTTEEIKAMRDDIRAICWKAHEPNGAKHCREVGDSDSQRHIYNDCWKSGWSGRGNLRCKYGFEPYGTNTQGHGDQAVHAGANGGRRLEVDSDGLGSGMIEEDFEEFGAGVDTDRSVEFEKPVSGGGAFFDLPYVEDEDSVTQLGQYTYKNSNCVLQGMEAVESDKVAPKCIIKPNDEGVWELKQASANCYVFCHMLNPVAPAY